MARFVTGVNNKREALCLPLCLLAGGYDPVSWPAVYPALRSGTDIGHTLNGTATGWGSGKVPNKCNVMGIAGRFSDLGYNHKNDMILFEFTSVNGYTHPSLKIKFDPLVNWI
ncbi:hypothetical protein GWQ29_08415 [Aeromonas sp. 2HA2]|uniref:hypothetical protein n=1 Tax=Aeromonas sp. 2HA2 TaxID=2699194 RepID=UPI0023DDA4E6|nr:hypothetical protein [Aeromonas sp. 2HA2]MDF2409442.1 hypothetical protein [Aeromonas sp. 2HA2]